VKDMIDEKKHVIADVKNNSDSNYSEGNNYQFSSFELTNKQLTQAIQYSEVFGKPKCKTRRRR
jgi:hypothetical protein